MRASRFYGRALLAPHLALALARSLAGRAPAAVPRRILVAHHLLLGDTLQLTALIARLRAAHPDAEIVMTVPVATAPLYEGRPYGVVAWPFDPRRPATLRAMLARKGFDLAVVPGDNRYSWLAMALGARWIVAHDGDRPAWKNWLVDRRVPYPDVPTAWVEIAAQLADGAAPAPYRPAQWPAPACRPFERPGRPYCVLHVGASTPLKLWQPEKWLALARHLAGRGLAVAWSGGRGEEAIVAAIDPAGEFPSHAGRLDLPQLWHLLGDARLLVCPDTGVAHLGRIVGTPTVALFGPGSARLHGAGEFWRECPYRAVTVEDVPCRDQHVLFRREVAWVRTCRRSPAQCAVPACMHAIGLDAVVAAVEPWLEAA